MEMERVMGIEPTLRAWEAPVLPLNYTRLGAGIFTDSKPARQVRHQPRRALSGLEDFLPGSRQSGIAGYQYQQVTGLAQARRVFHRAADIGKNLSLVFIHALLQQPKL